MTNPPVSMPCLHAISSLLEKNRKQRIGAIGFESFTDNPFFRPIDFEALVRKEIEPIFKPSSEKTNFDATYDLEELLLEEAPLEARARRQKPREQLKPDATEQEIRAEELHKMIETLFEPFNYTAVAADRTPVVVDEDTEHSNNTNSTPSPNQEWARPSSQPKSSAEGAETLRVNASVQNRSVTHSPNGSPPLPAVVPSPTPPSQRSGRERDRELDKERTRSRDRSRAERSDYFPSDGKADTSPPPHPSFSRPINPRTRGSTRSTSMGGGVQVVLNETGSWSDMANQGTGLLREPDRGDPRPSGMLGFFNRKKGRDRSPKAKERGVLGKEGARVVISNT